MSCQVDSCNLSSLKALKFFLQTVLGNLLPLLPDVLRMLQDWICLACQKVAYAVLNDLPVDKSCSLWHLTRYEDHVALLRGSNSMLEKSDKREQ